MNPFVFFDMPNNFGRPNRRCRKVLFIGYISLLFVISKMEGDINIFLQGSAESRLVDYMVSGGIKIPSAIHTAALSSSGVAYLPDSAGEYAQNVLTFRNFLLSDESLKGLPLTEGGIVVSVNGQPIGMYDSVDFDQKMNVANGDDAPLTRYQTTFVPTSKNVIEYPELKGGDIIEWKGLGKIQLPENIGFDDVFSTGLKRSLSTQVDGSPAKIRLILSDTHEQFNPFESQVVPFVRISNERFTAHWELNPASLESTLVAENDSWVLPNATIPLQSFSIADNENVVVLREAYSDHLSLCTLGANNIVTSIPFLDKYTVSVFRSGVVFNNRLYIIVFDGVTSQNWMLRTLELATGVEVLFDPEFQLAVGGPGEFHFDYKFGVIATNDSIMIAGGNQYGIIQPHIPGSQAVVHQLNRQDLFAKLVGSSSNAVGLFVDTLSEDYGFDNPIVTSNNFHLVEFNNNQKSGMDAVVSAPWSMVLYDDDVMDLGFVTNVSELINLYRLDIAETYGSGTLYLGANNAQGRIAWGACFYLDGFCDILSHRPVSDNSTSELETFYRDVKTRLDLEMWMLDRLHDFGKPGMYSVRYGLDRSKPLLFAVHTARLASLISTYWNLSDPVPETNFEGILLGAHALKDHVEEIVPWEVNNGVGIEEIPLVTTRKGVTVSFDGVPVPYNMQNAWAESILTSPLSTPKQKSDAVAMVKYFVTNEKLDSDPEATKEWLYWHGPAREGWDTTAELSENNSSYPGHKGFAAVSYRYMDAKAVFVAHAQQPEDKVLKAADEHLKEALSGGFLWLANTWQNGVDENIGELHLKHLARAWRSFGCFGIVNSSAAIRHVLANPSYLHSSRLDTDLDGIPDEQESFYELDLQQPNLFYLRADHTDGGITLSWKTPGHLAFDLRQFQTVDGIGKNVESAFTKDENEPGFSTFLELDALNVHHTFYQLYLRGRHF